MTGAPLSGPSVRLSFFRRLAGSKVELLANDESRILADRIENNNSNQRVALERALERRNERRNELGRPRTFFELAGNFLFACRCRLSRTFKSPPQSKESGKSGMSESGRGRALSAATNAKPERVRQSSCVRVCVKLALASGRRLAQHNNRMEPFVIATKRAPKDPMATIREPRDSCFVE